MPAQLSRIVKFFEAHALLHSIACPASILQAAALQRHAIHCFSSHARYNAVLLAPKISCICCCLCDMQNWGKELKLWLGERVVPVVVDDTRAEQVKKSFQVRAVKRRDGLACCGTLPNLVIVWFLSA